MGCQKPVAKLKSVHVAPRQAMLHGAAVAAHDRRRALGRRWTWGCGTARYGSTAVVLLASTLGPVVAGSEDATATSASAGLPGWAAHGRLDKVAGLLSLRANVNYQDSSGGQAALHAVAQSGHVAASLALLEARAAVDLEEEQALRPLHWAALHGHVAASAVLLEANAAPGRPPDVLGQHPLHLAARVGAEAVVELLLSQRAPPDEADAEGCTPLLWAAYGGHRNAAMLLLAQRVDVNARDETGQTALHWAARGHTPTVKLLLQHGASAAIADTTGRRPSFWAEQELDGQLCALLAAREGEAGESSGDEGRSSKPWIVNIEL